MIVHQKNKQKRILSSFTHPLVTLNLYQFLTLVEHKEHILKNACYQRVDSSHWIPQNRKKNTMEVNGYCHLFGLFLSFLGELCL